MTSVALVGAGGKMGQRLTRNLRAAVGYDVRYCENSPVGIERLAAQQISVLPMAEALRGANVVILAVPDAALRNVSATVRNYLTTGSVVILLDPAAAMVREVAMRDDVTYVVCHPCHPPLFGQQNDAVKDFFGGVSAPQDIVIALMRGCETAFVMADAVCRCMFAPVVAAHRISVEQMAVLEPAMAEVVAATAATIMREALEMAVSKGVPREAATSFMLGHAQIPLAIVFGAIPSPFSDAAKIAIEYGKRHILRDDWSKVFEPEHVQACIGEMLHPRDRA